MLRVISYMNDICGICARLFEGSVKHIRVGLAAADILGQEGEVKIFSGVGFVDIRIPVGQSAKREPSGKHFEYAQRFLIKHHLAAFLQEYVKCLLRATARCILVIAGGKL